MYGKIVFNNVKEFTPSWIRAPPESLMPISGTRRFMAWSMIFV